ncbi:MAG: GIY-YIG nuclease family protein [Dehalococcoidia bacterium]|nr:GIY-YIG nuclease family protein [Dehalococcoidia bacterium]
MTNQKLQAWKNVIDKMPELLQTLNLDNFRTPDNQGDLPRKGCYVLYENGKPIYVGRSKNLPSRIDQHVSNTKSATFAYLLAKKCLTDLDIEPMRIPGKPSSRITNADVKNYPNTLSEARERVSKMQFRIVKVNDDYEQYSFELYAALELGTTLEQGGYNSFETS